VGRGVVNERERPTAPGSRDVSAVLVVRPPFPRLPLYDWFYRDDPRWEGGVRVEDCACGGRLVLYLGEQLPTVVANHNETPLHRAWRQKGGG
jgi:hypothetical protein